jgi:hypothetical protein
MKTNRLSTGVLALCLTAGAAFAALDPACRALQKTVVSQAAQIRDLSTAVTQLSQTHRSATPGKPPASNTHQTHCHPLLDDVCSDTNETTSRLEERLADVEHLAGQTRISGWADVGHVYLMADAPIEKDWRAFMEIEIERAYIEPTVNQYHHFHFGKSFHGRAQNPTELILHYTGSKTVMPASCAARWPSNTDRP